MSTNDKKRNIYLIDDEIVKEARRVLSHSLKYMLESGNRKKLNDEGYADPFLYYNLYILAFSKLSNCTRPPTAFMKAMASNEITVDCLDGIIREFLFETAFYLKTKRASLEDIEVSFLPFYLNSSVESFFGQDYSKRDFWSFVFDKLIGSGEYTKQDLFDMEIVETTRF